MIRAACPGKRHSAAVLQIAYRMELGFAFFYAVEILLKLVFFSVLGTAFPYRFLAEQQM